MARRPDPSSAIGAPELARKQRLLALVTGCVVVLCSFFAIEQLIARDDLTMAMVLGASALFGVGTLAVERWSGNPELAGKYLAALIVCLIGMLSFARGGVVYGILAWTLPLPVAAVLMTRTVRASVRWGAAASAMAIGLYLLQTGGHTPAFEGSTPATALIGFLALTWTLVVIAGSYESTRRRLECDMGQLERELDEARRANLVGRFAGGVAHEVNNLLFVVQATADLALDPATSDDERDAHARRLRIAIERGAGLTEKLLRLTSHQVSQSESLDLSGEVGELVPRLEAEACAADITIELDTRDQPLEVRWQRAHVEHALRSLLDNAVGAMPAGGTVRIATRAHGADAVLTVSDDGTGMDDEVRGRALEPFYTTKPIGHATGLGLSTVDALARRAGGQIELASTAGVGTTVTVRLPRVRQP